MVQLENSVTINRFRYDLNYLAGNSNYNASQANKLNGQGLYYVMSANHSGDTRGNEWYTDLTCLAINASFNPQDGSFLEAFQVGAGPIKRY